MFRQYRPASVEIDPRVLISEITQHKKNQLNIILLDIFDLDERLHLGKHGRNLMVDIMYRTLTDLERRVCAPGVHIPFKTLSKIMYRNKDVLYRTLEADIIHENLYYSLRPRHLSKRERISPPNSL